MLSIIISIFVGTAVFFAMFSLADAGGLWSGVLAFLAFIASQAISGIFLKKRVQEKMDRVQGILAEGQKRIQTKMQRWQLRPPGSVQAAQREIFEDTKVFVKEAIEATKDLERFKLWVPMIDRQIATAQFQLYWMIKEFKKVDMLMPKALFFDPTMSAMKIARMYMRGDDIEAISKVYAKAVRHLKYNQGVLLNAAYSWILIKREKIDEAFKALTAALKNSDSEVLKRNHELLMNNRIAHFSNSGLGDQWYSLMLEEPKVKTQRQRAIFR